METTDWEEKWIAITISWTSLQDKLNWLSEDWQHVNVHTIMPIENKFNVLIKLMRPTEGLKSIK